MSDIDMNDDVFDPKPAAEAPDRPQVLIDDDQKFDVQPENSANPDAAPFRDRVPANWIVHEMEDGRVAARNPLTQERFEGTREALNEKLAG